LDSKSEKGRLIVITGPSGVGKSSIVSEVRRRTGAEFSVSVTTRKPRANERDKKDYAFVDEKTFRNMVDADELLEWAEVFGECYGTPAEPVLQTVSDGKDIILEIDVQGALQIVRRVPDAKFILIAPPSMDVLRQRLTARRSETPQQVAGRSAKADKEIRTARQSGIYQHEIVNDDLETAIDEVVTAIDQEQLQR